MTDALDTPAPAAAPRETPRLLTSEECTDLRRQLARKAYHSAVEKKFILGYALNTIDVLRAALSEARAERDASRSAHRDYARRIVAVVSAVNIDVGFAAPSEPAT